jgi:hypothetical protein
LIRVCSDVSPFYIISQCVVFINPHQLINPLNLPA